jgi:hypothetical protein
MNIISVHTKNKRFEEIHPWERCISGKHWFSATLIKVLQESWNTSLNTWVPCIGSEHLFQYTKESG